MPFCVGLTGGIGSGKSVVSGLFEALGAAVVDTDEISRALTAPGGAAIGAWLGWKMLPLTILASSLVGAVVGIGLIVFAKHAREKPIPFGPYLAAAGLIALFWGERINKQYLDLF